MHLVFLGMFAFLVLPASVVGQSVAPGGKNLLPPGDSAATPWSIAPRTGSPAEGWPVDPLPMWSVPPRHGRAAPVPLPQIGLPLRPTGLPPIHGSNLGRRYHRGRAVGPWPFWVVVVPHTVAAVAPDPPAPAPPIEEPSRIGSLLLDVTPGTAQIFVDGYYVGTPDDLDAARRGMTLETGPHRIELAAPGYEGIGFDVRIVPKQSIVYRAALKSTAPLAPSPPQLLSAPVTFYLIPGCYAGNVHPKEATLRPSCDLSRMITVQP